MAASQVNVQPRLHPIGEPGHLLQTRAIGVMEGMIAPKGVITLLTSTGSFHGEALIIGADVHGLVRKLLSKGENSAMFVVYPQTKDGLVNKLQVIGVWKPSILDPNSGAQDDLPEEFSIRGEVHRVGRSNKYGYYVAVRVNGGHYVTVDFGQAPYLQPGDFVSMDAILTPDDRLDTERVEKISVPEAAKASPHRHGHQVVRQRSSAA